MREREVGQFGLLIRWEIGVGRVRGRGLGQTRSRRVNFG